MVAAYTGPNSPGLPTIKEASATITSSVYGHYMDKEIQGIRRYIYITLTIAGQFVGFRINSHGRKRQVMSCSHHACSYFAAVGNEEFMSFHDDEVETGLNF